MRVIEPQQLQRKSIKKKRKPYSAFAVVLALLVIAYVAYISVTPKKIDSTNNSQVQPAPTTQVVSTAPKNTLKTYTNEQFVALYNSFAYPNTQDIVTPPSITGNGQADTRIRQLAEARGYKLRSAPVAPPIHINGDFLLQQKALQPLQDLITAAKKLDLPITVTAAFRSVDEQRNLFIERLAAKPAAIAAGTADADVIETLKTTAPPGYSRHHNGFTIDIACGSVGLYGFLDTPCFAWLSKDNFKNAKEFGWIPSYPGGINSTGPEPEPWEYVWVGRDALLE